MKQTVTVMIDDITGKPDDDVTEIPFSVDGKSYTIDLNEDNAKLMRDAFAPYIAKATAVEPRTGSRNKGTGKASGGGGKRNRDEVAAIRDWAQSNGYDVAARGRIPGDIKDAYYAAQGTKNDVKADVNADAA